MPTMFRRTHWLSVAIGCFLVAGLVALAINPMWGADHADAPLLIGAGRHDARLTDLYAFVRGEDLVLALCSNPTIPAEVAAYRFPQDLTLRFHIDNHSEVLFDDFNDLEEFGGTIVRPNKISDNIMIEVTFDRDGTALFKFEGLPERFANRMDVFAGLRDDPFIRTPRDGKNVAAVVVALPLEAVLDAQPTLLIWGTSKVPDIGGPISEHAGRALRSQFLDGMNTVRPRDHLSTLGYVPDVMIFNTLYDAAYPNGRELTDDVVDLVVPPISLPGEDPENRENDVPFLEEFPYLPPPHPA
jgi:hypothetical protein